MAFRVRRSRLRSTRFGEEERIDPAEALAGVVTKKLRSMSKLDAPTKRRRLYGFLARRGYEPDEIHIALKQIV